MVDFGVQKKCCQNCRKNWDGGCYFDETGEIELDVNGDCKSFIPWKERK